MIFGFIVYSECFLYSFLIDSFTVSFHDLCWYPQCLHRTGWSRLEQAGAGVVMVGGWSVVWPRSAQWETGDKRAREEWTPWDDHSNGDHSAPVSRPCLRSHLVDKLCFTFIVHCPELRVIYQLGLVKTVSNSFIKTILFVKSLIEKHLLMVLCECEHNFSVITILLENDWMMMVWRTWIWGN